MKFFLTQSPWKLICANCLNGKIAMVGFTHLDRSWYLVVFLRQFLKCSQVPWAQWRWNWVAGNLPVCVCEARGAAVWKTSAFWHHHHRLIEIKTVGFFRESHFFWSLTVSRCVVFDNTLHFRLLHDQIDPIWPSTKFQVGWNHLTSSGWENDVIVVPQRLKQNRPRNLRKFHWVSRCVFF